MCSCPPDGASPTSVTPAYTKRSNAQPDGSGDRWPRRSRCRCRCTRSTFWSRLSPTALIVPADVSQHRLRQGAVDCGRVHASRRCLKLRREYGETIPPDYHGGGSRIAQERPPRHASVASQTGGILTSDPPCSTILIYYYEPTLNPDAFHPKRICELVFVEGIETEVRHRYCPYQSLDNGGRADSQFDDRVPDSRPHAARRARRQPRPHLIAR